jgi:hypothetical protein
MWEAKERALSYAIGQLRVNSLTPSMSVPRQASKEGSGFFFLSGRFLLSFFHRFPGSSRSSLVPL